MAKTIQVELEAKTDKAIKELERITHEIGFEMALEAAQAARYAKRKTIIRKDIKLIAGKS